MPAQCHDRTFQLFKKHFGEEYKKIWQELLDTVVTVDNIVSVSDEMSDLIRSYISMEPTGIPTMSEWTYEVDAFKERMIELREESIMDMELLF